MAMKSSDKRNLILLFYVIGLVTLVNFIFRNDPQQSLFLCVFCIGHIMGSIWSVASKKIAN